MYSICFLKVRPQSEIQRNIMWEALQIICLANLHIQNAIQASFLLLEKE